MWSAAASGAIRLTGPDVDEQAIRAYYAKALERAATLGVKSIVFGSAGAKRVPESFDMDRAYQQVVQVTRETGEAAAKYGITIVIEPVRMPDCNIINTFAESYDFKGKTVIPFCTYASTYRDETLAKIVELTPDAKHLKGFGAVSRNTDGITEWLKEIKVIK